MTEVFTVTLSSSPAKDAPELNDIEEREIWLRSTSSFVIGGLTANPIAFEKVHDNHPSGQDPLTASELAFSIAIGNEDNLKAPIDLPEGVIFPTASIRLDTKGHPFIWAGFGAKAVVGDAYAVTFPENSEVVSSLSPGDFIYLRITVGVQTDPEWIYLKQYYGLKRAPRLDALYTIGGGSFSGVNDGGPDHGENDVPPDPLENENIGQRQVRRGHRRLDGIIGWIFDCFGSLPRHWAVVVREYYHELIIGQNKTILYQNRAIVNAGANFKFDHVGYTILNDQEIVTEGNDAIAVMAEADEIYDIKYNNCHKFCISLFDRICIDDPPREKFFTSYSLTTTISLKPQADFKDFNEITSELGAGRVH